MGTGLLWLKASQGFNANFFMKQTLFSKMTGAQLKVHRWTIALLLFDNTYAATHAPILQSFLGYLHKLYSFSQTLLQLCSNITPQH